METEITEELQKGIELWAAFLRAPNDSAEEDRLNDALACWQGTVPKWVERAAFKVARAQCPAPTQPVKED